MVVTDRFHCIFTCSSNLWLVCSFASPIPSLVIHFCHSFIYSIYLTLPSITHPLHRHVHTYYIDGLVQERRNSIANALTHRYSHQNTVRFFFRLKTCKLCSVLKCYQGSLCRYIKLITLNINKWSVLWQIFPCHDVIMLQSYPGHPQWPHHRPDGRHSSNRCLPRGPHVERTAERGGESPDLPR